MVCNTQASLRLLQMNSPQAPAPVLVATTMRQFGPSGVQTHFRELIHHLEQRGWPCQLVNSFTRASWMVPAAAFRRVIEKMNPSVSVRWHVLTHGLSLRGQLRRHLRGGEPAVVYAQCPLSAAAALDARANPGQRVVLAVHFNLSQAAEWVTRGMIREGDAVWKAIVAQERAVLPKVDGIVFVSEFMKGELSRRIPGIDGVPSAIIPNFVRVHAPSAAPLPDLAPADLVSVGSLEPRKNQAYLLDILAAAQRQGTELTLTLIGDGASRSALVAHARALGVERLVNFAGYMRDASQVLGRHRALIHVARMENLPIVLIEAMAQGLPIFATPVGGIPELFEDGQEGWHIPLDDANAAAATITRVLRDKAVLSEAGFAAHRRFLARYDAALVAEHLRHFLIQGGSAVQ
jgi:glycosyltransferase involved in cell wall biosynthesis